MRRSWRHAGDGLGEGSLPPVGIPAARGGRTCPGVQRSAAEGRGPGGGPGSRAGGWRPEVRAGREGVTRCPVGPWSPGSARFPEPGPQLTATRGWERSEGPRGRGDTAPARSHRRPFAACRHSAPP